MTFSNYVGPLIVALTMTWLLLATIIDLRRRRIPNALLALAVPFAVMGTLYYEGFNLAGLLSVVLGGGAYFGCMLALAILTGGIGGGDVKMGAVIGLALGWPSAMLAFAVSWFAAGFVGIIAREKTIPMAPLLLGGALFSLVVVRM